MNYKFGTKNNWRRWFWNRIAERAKDKNDWVIYLGTEECLDIPIIREHGFKNAVAVNRDEAVCREIRRRGYLAVAGDLIPIIQAWSPDWPIGVVAADLTCGLTGYPVSLLCSIGTARAVRNSTIVVGLNLMRGRDAISNSIRREIKKECGQIPFNAWYIDALQKHRGCQVIWKWKKTVIDDPLRRRFGFVDPATVGSYRIQLGKIMNAASFSYRSEAGSLVFDSTVFELPIRLQIPEFGIVSARFTQDPDSIPFLKRQVDICERRLAALKALRTMGTIH